MADAGEQFDVIPRSLPARDLPSVIQATQCRFEGEAFARINKGRDLIEHDFTGLEGGFRRSEW